MNYYNMSMIFYTLYRVIKQTKIMATDILQTKTDMIMCLFLSLDQYGRLCRSGEEGLAVNKPTIASKVELELYFGNCELYHISSTFHRDN